MYNLPILLKYSCPVCPERFASLHEKRQHVKAEHSRLIKKES